MEKAFVIILVGLVLSIFISGCAQQGVYSQQTQTSGQTTSSGTGRAVFAITDAAANIGSVTSVKVTINSIKVHSTTEGWVVVSSTPKTYDLLKLKAESKQELLADAELKEGTYDQIRLDISNVVVTDAEGTHEAKLPSGELKISGNLVVKANSTSTATFDFVADESLHVTGNGKYIMAPVIQVETREDADVDVESNNKVEVKGGKIHTNVRVGMDAEGNVGVGLRIPENINLSIDSGGIIKVGGKGSGKIGIEG